MSSFHDPFRAAIRSAVRGALDLPADAEVQLGAPPNPAMGDVAVPMFPYARTLRNAPPRIAQAVVAAFEPGGGVSEATAAGPYVNFRLDRSAFLAWVLETIDARGDAYGHVDAPLLRDDGEQRTVVIDFSSPNISKHLAYHHIRSTMIGNALCRIHRALGWRAIGFNFLGDWGTTHGMLLAAWTRADADLDLDEDGVTKLNEMYVAFREAMKTDPSLEGEARAWFARLEQGDAEARALWERFRAVSLAEFEKVYARLGVTFEAVCGESFYEDRMEPVIEHLSAQGLTAIDDGALVVDLSEQGMPPCLLKKQDGATLYATRDIASAVHRHEEWQFDRALYVVGKGQTLHFKQWFAVVEKGGYAFAGRMEHTAFGQIRMGGVKVSSRDGAVRLHDVLDRASEEIGAVIAEKNPTMSAERRHEVAQQVGYGAIVFADLSRERERDVEFDWDRLLSFEGDTGPYCQYQHARIASIVRKAGRELGGADLSLLTTDDEWQVALLLAAFPERVEKAGKRAEPHWVAGYVLELCRAFSSWYAQGSQDPALKVNCADDDTARARLALAHAVQQTLRNALDLLGLAAPEEM